MKDNIGNVYNKFFEERTKNLFHRFPGWYRAVVEETNDPLDLRRIKFRCPELHDNNVPVKLLPWAVPAPWMGGINAGSFTHPMIGDQVFICFEKNHPYGPIYAATADPTRRRQYSLLSIYTRTPTPVSEDGTEIDRPKDSDDVQEYLPQDGRPMSTGINDRYGNYFILSSVGFFPKTHDTDPAPAGTDGLSRSDFEIAKQPPKKNDPDGKFAVWGTKYGHFGIMGDQGYDWSEEFDGEFLEDEQHEISRYTYLVKHFHEEKSKEYDQRRIEWRTRAGHKLELRDVGWEKSRSGEYGEVKTIANSDGRDERWVKLRSKGGHLFELIDIGFDPESDTFYKELNKSETGPKPDKEDDLGSNQGDDARMIRIITRHGNQLILDDRGSSPTNADTDEETRSNGFLLRSRRGFQIQGVDKDEVNHLMMATPKDQVFEINDKFQHIILSTTQSDEVHTKIENPKTRPRYIPRTGITHDPEANTFHLKLDKQNSYVRLATPEGAGIEFRDGAAPCGTWSEYRDNENRAVWLSKQDQWLLIRDKTGGKFILLDDNDDVILIRNENGKIQIRAQSDIEIKSDTGNICLEAPSGQIGMTAQSVDIATGGASHKIDGAGMGTSGTMQGSTLRGFHPQMGCAFAPGGGNPGSGAGARAGKPGNPCRSQDKDIARKKPEDFDQERGCDDLKPQKGEIPETVFNTPPGGGGGGGNPPPSSGGGGGGGGGGSPTGPLPNDDPRVAPPPRSDSAPDEPSVTDPPPPNPDDFADPIEQVNPGGGGVLWYGTSSVFLEEIEEVGLLINSLSNNLNVPDDKTAVKFELSKSLEYARSRSQSVLAKQRYGGTDLIIRIRSVPDSELLSSSDNPDVINYAGDIPFDGNLEIFEISNLELSDPPLFPSIG